jgi:hypothetical protein
MLLQRYSSHYDVRSSCFLLQAESFVSSCYAGTGLYYRGDTAGSDVCVRDCDPASKFVHQRKMTGFTIQPKIAALLSTAGLILSSVLHEQLMHSMESIGQTNQENVIRTQ